MTPRAVASRARTVLERRARARARRAFYRSRAVREVVAGARRVARRDEAPDLGHLTMFNERAGGAVQRDEALLLHALIRVVRPQTVVEIGFLRGHSAFNFLCALDDDARVYSFDLDPGCAALAAEHYGHDARLVFQTRSQTEITRADIGGRLADFVFLDASHDLSLNQTTFERLLGMMAPDAVLAVHDTGTMPRALLESAGHWALWHADGWVDDAWEVAPGERAFVNWVLEKHPGFSQLHLHSRRTLRCGITLLQRSGPLPRPGTPAASTLSPAAAPPP